MLNIIKACFYWLLSIELAEAPLAISHGVRDGTTPVVLPGTVDHLVNHLRSVGGRRGGARWCRRCCCCCGRCTRCGCWYHIDHSPLESRCGLEKNDCSQNTDHKVLHRWYSLNDPAVNNSKSLRWNIYMPTQFNVSFWLCVKKYRTSVWKAKSLAVWY